VAEQEVQASERQVEGEVDGEAGLQPEPPLVGFEGLEQRGRRLHDAEVDDRGGEERQGGRRVEAVHDLVQAGRPAPHRGAGRLGVAGDQRHQRVADVEERQPGEPPVVGGQEAGDRDVRVGPAEDAAHDGLRSDGHAERLLLVERAGPEGYRLLDRLPRQLAITAAGRQHGPAEQRAEAPSR
jgi:hypothetical protein